VLPVSHLRRGMYVRTSKNPSLHSTREEIHENVPGK
jgi:hypothetical protein